MHKLLLATPLAFAGAFSHVSYAQTTDASSSESRGQLGTVTVEGSATNGFVANTVEAGTFRGANILEVPATVNTVTRDVFELQGAAGIYDVLRNTAGVTRQQNGGDTFDQLVIRGIAVENRTNYRLNGSLAIPNVSEIPMENKERVEVLKGASALYYGFTTPAGIINLVTKRAGSTPVSSVGLTVDDKGSLQASTDIGRQFGDQNQYGLRINAAGGRVGSNIDGIDGNRRFVSAAFDWRVNSRLTLKADIENYRKRITEQAGITRPAAVRGVITLPALPDPDKLLGPAWAVFDAEVTNTQLRADYSLSNNWALMVEAGHSEAERDRRLASFGNYNVQTGLGRITGNDQSLKQTSDLFRTELFGTFSTGSVQHELTLGAAQSKKTQDPIFQRNYGGASTAQNLYNPIVIGYLPLTAMPTRPTTGAQDSKELGLYALDRITFSPQWQLVVGARRTHFESTQGASATIPLIAFDVRKTTPLAALSYKFTPDLAGYVSYAEGVEEGEIAPAGTANQNAHMPPGISKQKEIGLRWLTGGGMLLSGALFDIERPGAYTNSANTFVADGRQRYRGLELSAQGRLTRALAWQLSAQSLDAEFRDINAQYNGKLPENTAKQTASAFLSYDIAAVPGLSVNGGAYYTGRRPVDDLNQAFIGGNTIFGLGARYVTQLFGKRTLWQINIDNVGDKRYWAAAGTRLAVGAPRSVKATLKIDL
ncbi:TonB-dependent siderophore receptor [Variovorax sp. ZS18.2.2]|uniref:TonB-dependent siderophore receptor n=1 Tax=Variovorax sp. ZS18.2.2 TaxID=2971255 RepID=UPI002151719C|nr:TonB-dependent siderophore receptor [Variovorax sp. ZS18.2.2]MCR6475988.1 TonB-dependent siderophore receptor [Variovorax sp. ZS18.2.2]